VQGNSLFNSTVRDTDEPVTPIDVVGASGWVVRDNLIADFAKGIGQGNIWEEFLRLGLSLSPQK